MTAINFLTRTGQACTPTRQEFVLLFSVLGVSALIDELNNPTLSGGTASSIIGPFFTDDAPDSKIRSSSYSWCLFSSDPQSASEIPSHPKAKEIICTSKDASRIFMGTLCRMLPLKLGKLILKVLSCTVYCIRVADNRGAKGFYDTQYSDRSKPDCRGRPRSDEEG